MNAPNITPQTLRQRVEAQIEKELARCERCMTPAQWREHREWVTAYVTEGAREWLSVQSARGEL